MTEPEIDGNSFCTLQEREKAFGFEYNKDWIKTTSQLLIDPDIQFFRLAQFPNNKENFGVFLDSMPDTWGAL